NEVARTIASPLGQPVRTVAQDENNLQTTMLIYPDGRVSVESTGSGTPPLDPGPLPPAPPTAGPVPPVTGAHRQERPSFITAGRTIQPALKGWRGALNNAGLRLAPGPAEQAERVDVAAVARHWPGTRTVAVINAKGSASK